MKIAVYGYGTMGKLIVDILKEKKNIIFVGAVDEKETIYTQCYKNLNSLPEKPDVIIDFSHFSKLNEILEYANKNKVALLIATTGHSENDKLKLEEAGKKNPILVASNTSLGVNLLNELMKYIVPVLENWDIELIEKHHNKKLDSPSGTAKTLLENINNTLKEKKEYKYGREGMEKRETKEIGVHSVRGGTIVGEHSVIFAGEDEVIEIKHEAHSKKIFANGAITGAIWLANQDNGMYKMSDVLLGKK
ncbi:MAG: 4-hydroxy-tetrahydrodipicolinate reductase [Fusobacteriaceae bacterium]